MQESSLTGKIFESLRHAELVERDGSMDLIRLRVLILLLFHYDALKKSLIPIQPLSQGKIKLASSRYMAIKQVHERRYVFYRDYSYTSD